MTGPSRDADRAKTAMPGPVVALLVVLVATTAIPSASFTTANTPRGASVDVVDDEQGVLALDTNPSVVKNRREPLVNVTNNLGEDVRTTVALVDGADGTLIVGAQTGDQVTVYLPQGATETVYVQVDANPNTDIVFDVAATGQTVDVTAAGRSTYVTNPSGGNNGQGQGSNNGQGQGSTSN